MSIELLDKTRMINRLLHDNRFSKVAFTDICKVLGDLLQSDVYVLSQKGKLLGIYLGNKEKVIECFPDEVGMHIDKKMNGRFLNVLSTKENFNLETLGFPKATIGDIEAVITPITIAGERFGTLFLYRYQQPYEIEDIILSEYATTVVGLELMRSVMEEKDERKRSKKVLSSAITTLSPLETKAMVFLFRELDGMEGIVVTSKVAEKYSITRTVIVNALRKLESAGLIHTRSSGMKGTHIEVLSNVVFSELESYYNEKWNSKTQKEL